MADDVNANIRIDLDTSDALASLRNLQSQISTFNKSVIQSNAAAVAAQRSMLSSLTAQIGATGQFATSMVNVETSVSRLGRSIDKNKLSLGEYFRYGVASSKNFGRVFGREHNAIMELATERVRRLQTQYIAMGEAQNGVTRALALRPFQLFNADSAISIQRQQLFNKLLHDGSTSLINFGKNTQWAGRQLMVGFTVPLTIFGGMAGKVFMDLEKQIVKFRRVYGDATTPLEETNGMINQIKELAGEFTKYGIAVSDTIGLAGDAAAAGAQGADLIAATTEATRLSTLGMIDQQQALTATIALQSAFRLSTEELANATNFLNAVENQTVVSLADITEAIPKVAPVIQGLGGDVQDLAIFMAAMREGGVSAGEGANALKSGLASLINPTKAAREQLAGVGINIDSILSKNKGDIRATVMAFGDALMSLDKFTRQQTLAKMFGKYQFARLGALFENISRQGSQAQRVIDLTTMSVQDLGQLADKELSAIEESVGVKFTGAMERLKLAIAPVGEAFLKIATPIIEFATKMFEKFNELSPSVKNFIVILTAGLGVVVPTVIMLIGLFANFAGNAIKGLSLMNNFFNRLRGGAGTLDYLSNEQLDAAAAAASLEGKTTALTTSLNIQRTAVNQLAKAYGTYAASARAAAGNLPQGFRRPPVKMASGGVVGGTGNKDTEPALLTPGEFVMNRRATEKFGPILDAMNRGNVSGYADGSRMVPAYGETALRLQSGTENIARRASSIIVEEVLSILSLRVGEGRGMIPSQSQVSRGTFDPVAKELEPIAKDFVAKVNSHFNKTFKDISNTDDRMAAAWKRAGQDMEQTVNQMQDIDRAVVRRYMGLEEDVYGTIPTEKRRRGDTELTRARKGAFTRAAGGPRSYTGIGGSARAMYGRLSGRSAEGMQLGHVFKPRSIDLSVLAKDPNATSAVKTAMRNLGEVGSNEMAATIAREDPTGHGLASEAGRKSPHRQAKKNAIQDGGAYAQTYALTVDDELSRKFKEKFPELRQSGAGRVAIARPEDIGRMHDIDQAHAMAIDEDTKRTGELTKEKKTLKQRISKTAGKVAGIGLAADGLVFAASMMGGSVGEFAQKIMPVVFGFQGLAMMIPTMMNPIGAVTMGLAASAAAIWFFKSKADEMTANAQKFVDSMIATRATIDKVGEFFGTKSLVQRQTDKIIKEQTGAKPEEVTKAQEFVKSDIGLAMQEGLGVAFQKFGASAAADQFAANLASMVLQGVVDPAQAKAIAMVMGQTLGNEQFGINVNGKLNELLGPDNVNLLKNPLQLAIDISKQNQKTVEGLTQNFDSLALSMQNFNQWTAGDTAAAFVPVFNVINTINKATLGWDNWFGQVARSARGILNPDDFEGVEASLKTIGSLAGNYLAQAYDNLSAAKERYRQISKKVKDIDDKDVAAKRAARRQAQEAKRDIDELTKQLQEQERSLRGMFAGGTEAARITVLEGMRESITKQFEDDPAMKLAWDMISGQMGDVSQDIQFNINMGISSGVLNPIAIQNLMSMFANPVEATATINFLINTYGTGTTNEMILNILNMQDPDIRKKAIIDLIINTPGGLDQQTLQMIDPSGELTKEALAQSSQGNIEILKKNAKDAQKELDNFKLGLSRARGNFGALPQNQERLAELTQKAAEAQNAYNDALEKNGPISADNAERIEKQEKALVPLKNEYYSLTSALKSAEDPVDVQINLEGLTPSDLQTVNSNLAIFNQFPPQTVKIAGIDTIGSPEELADLTEKYKGLESTKPKIVKKAIFEVLGAQGISKKEAEQQLDDMGYKIEEFAKLPNSTKYAILYNLEVDAKLNLELSNINDLMKSPGLTMQAATTLEQRRAEIEAARQTIAGELSALFNTTPDRNNGLDGGTGGSEKTKSWLEQLLADTIANVKLFVGNLQNGINPIISKLRSLNIPAQIIDAIGTGEEGLAKAKEILKLSKKQLQDFLKAYGDQAVGEAISGLEGRRTAATQKASARLLLQNRGAESDIIEKILQDEKMVYVVTQARGKELQKIINLYRSIEETEDPIQSRINKLIRQRDINLVPINKQIEAQKDIIEGIQDEISALEYLNTLDNDRIRSLEREVELRNRDAEKLERSNESDQNAIDALQRQDELRNRISESLSRELDAMSKQESTIRDAYQKRIDALEKVSSLNEKILQQQKDQLNVAQALSSGDIYAATKAAQEMRQNQIAASQQQARDALTAGMENAVAGLRTSGGLTREQAEAQIEQIKEQSYQTSLKIRDIEDIIYDRNLEIAKIKEDVRKKEDEIRTIQDVIYTREDSILGITRQRLEPAQKILTGLEDQRTSVEKRYNSEIDSLELASKLDDATVGQIASVDALAAAWYRVSKEIAKANKIAQEGYIDAGERPERSNYKSEGAWKAAVAEWSKKRKAIDSTREASIAAALALLPSTTAFGGGLMKYGMGGKIKGYAMGGMMPYAVGGSVFGNGSRDSIAAMLSPGEFVIRRAMVDKYGVPMMNAINQGALAMPRFNTGGRSRGNMRPTTGANNTSPVYNNYSVNVSVSGTSASADEIANKTITKIKQMQNMQIRSNRGY